MSPPEWPNPFSEGTNCLNTRLLHVLSLCSLVHETLSRYYKRHFLQRQNIQSKNNGVDGQKGHRGNPRLFISTCKKKDVHWWDISTGKKTDIHWRDIHKKGDIELQKGYISGSHILGRGDIPGDINLANMSIYFGQNVPKRDMCHGPNPNPNPLLDYLGNSATTLINYVN